MIKFAFEFMSDEFIIGILGGLIGGLIGGVLTVLSSWLSAYWAPKKLEERREAREENRLWGPRKKLIKEMLDMQKDGRGRSLKTLKRVTGTPDDELRRILVELGARGFSRSDGEEAWIYAKDRPLKND